MKPEDSSQMESMPTDLLTVQLGEKSPAPSAEEKVPAPPAVEKAPEPSPKFEETYRIIKLLGQGGMSAVYLAEHKVWKNLWALKIVKKDQNAFDMLAEPNLLKQLSHPILPHIVDIYEDEEQICIVEDYISGEDLWHYLVRNGPIPEALAEDWLRQLCDVLDYLHTREPNPIIFRDLKPANVMRREDGSLCLVDFGIARRYNPEGGSDTVHAWTIGYAAPEQMSTTLQTDARADIYSLGATLFQLLAGPQAKYLPGQFPRIRSLRPDISPKMDEILDRCLKPLRDDRYASVKELLADLDRQEHAGRGAGITERAGARPKAGIGRILVPAAIVLAIAAAGAFGVLRMRQASSGNEPASGQVRDGTQEAAVTQDTAQEAEHLQEDSQDAEASQEAAIESSGNYDTLLTKLYSALEESDYEKTAEVLAQSENRELFEALCSELETGNKYMLFDGSGGENVLAVYRYGLLYFGGWKDGAREGHGIWYALGDAEEMRFEGEWENDLPRGKGTVTVIARKKPAEWGDVYPVRQEREGTFYDGYYDGEFAIHWDMSDGSSRDYTPAYYELGVSKACTPDEIADALVGFGYTESQAQELADSHVLDEDSRNKKTIAISMDSEGRIFTMVEYLENGADPVSSVFGINM